MADGDTVDALVPDLPKGQPSDSLAPDQKNELSPQALNLASPMFNLHPSPEGIGGWLVLVAIGLVITPILLMQILWRDFHFLRIPTRLLIGMRVPGLPTLLALEFFNNAVMLAGLAFLVVLFFREKRQFPRLYELWLGYAVVARVTELTLSFRLGAESSWEGAAKVVADLHSKLGISVLQSVVAAIVWIGYFEVSKRAKATFIR